MKKNLHCAAFSRLRAIRNSQISTAFAQGAVFTYPGRLSSRGSPPNRSYDLACSVYNNTHFSSVANVGPVTNRLNDRELSRRKGA